MVRVSDKALQSDWELNDIVGIPSHAARALRLARPTRHKEL